MKKILIALYAIVAILLVASCQRIENPSAPGAESEVTFNVQGPDFMTRAYGDGTTADKLTVAVYDEQGNYLQGLDKEVDMENKHANISLTLVNGMTYKIVFWAQADGAPYTFDKGGKTLTVNYENALANDEERDAFYGVVEHTADGPKTLDVTLKRPFAQLNIATSDWDAAQNSGISLTQSKLTVSSVNTKMNMLTGEIITDQNATLADVEFGFANIPSEELSGYQSYQWLAVNYLLVNEEELVDVIFETDASATQTPKPITNVPVKRNYRTIIYGEMLTSDVNFNVNTDPGFTLPDITVDGRAYKQVDDVDAANALLEDDNSNVYAIAINSITADATITLPDVNTSDVHLILPGTNNSVTIEGNVTEYLYIEIPNGEIQNLTLNVPNTTAHVNGKLVNVVATTASSTLYITGGKVTNLVVNQGNVVVEKGAALDKVNNQSEEVITVTLAEDVEEPEVAENNVNIETIKQEVSTLEDLKAALAKLTTVTLGGDIETNEIITINRDIVFDGNGHTLTSNVSSNAVGHRAINVEGASDVTIRNLTIITNGQRAINLIKEAKKVTVDNVTATASNYAVNVAASASGATVVINNSTLTGLNVISLSADNITANINNSHLITIDNNSDEGYASINSGNSSVGNKVVMNSGTIYVKGDHAEDSYEATYVPEINSVTLNNVVAEDGELNIQAKVAVIQYGDYYYSFNTLEEAIDYADPGQTIRLVADVTLAAPITIEKELVLDLNGKKISYTSENQVAMLTNTAELTIKDSKNSGEILYTFTGSTANDGIAANTITNRGTLVLEGGKISNVCANSINQIGYAVDNYSGSTMNVIGGTVSAAGSGYYDGIRLFCGYDSTKEITVTVDGGAISTIWAQNPSANKATQVYGSVIINGGNINTTYYENYTTVKVKSGITATVTPYGNGNENTTTTVEGNYTVHSFVNNQ